MAWVRQRRNIIVLHVNGLLNAIAFWLTAPLLPFVLRELGASATSFGALQAVFNLAQIAGSLVLGYVQDHYSGRTALNLTHAGSMLATACLLLPPSLAVLYLSQVLSILRQTMQVLQAYVAAFTEPEHRLRHIGHLGASYAIGMAIGASASGFIAASVGLRGAGAAAIVVCILAVAVNAVFLDEMDLHTAVDKKKSDTCDSDSSTDASSRVSQPSKIVAYWAVMLSVRRLLLFATFLFCTRYMYEPVYSWLLIDKYGKTMQEVGNITGLLAGVGVVGSGILLSLPLKRWVGTRSLLRIGVAVTTALYALLAMREPTSSNEFVGINVGFSLSKGMLYMLCASYVTERTAKADHGKVIALWHGARAMAGVVSPVVATWVMEVHGPTAVACMTCALCIASWFALD
jgi:MFS family permease